MNMNTSNQTLFSKTSPKTSLARLVASALLAAAVGAAGAAGAEKSAPAEDKLTPVRAQLAVKKWAAAIDELKRINDTGSADWNNLMGYSLRKSSPPDYAGAERYYDEALRLDPQHRGALEYSGELYLMTGDLAKAQQRLAVLDKACFLPCSEYTDLKKAIERYKAAGNQYTAY
jgi:tetratricopeptide (TPR) repeat protein